nr:heterogeneous nuclear ribonucleoprotein 1 [Tanacetum cinerariifolium]
MNQSHTNDRPSPGKIFIGGLPKETEYNEFNNHFGKYGDITDSMIMKDHMSGQPRGFGFITYADPLVVDKVEIKRTIPRETANSKVFKTKKIFFRETSIEEKREPFERLASYFGMNLIKIIDCFKKVTVFQNCSIKEAQKSGLTVRA